MKLFNSKLFSIIASMGKKTTDAEFKVKLDGDLSEVDAGTLISSLIGISTAVQEINKELSTDKKIQVKIKALEKGSFLIHLRLIESYITSLLQNITTDQVSITCSLICTLAAILTIKKHLKGDSPKDTKEDGDYISLENSDGNIIEIDKRAYNIYINNSAIDNSLTKSFSTLSNDESITDFELLDNNDEVLFKASHDEFENIATLSTIKKEKERILEKIEVLKIFKIVFQENYKWEFYWQGNKIAAKMKDEKFNNEVNSGEERFAKGDTLRAEIHIYQIFDESIDTYINKSYEIAKVLEHIPRPEQMNISDI